MSRKVHLTLAKLIKEVKMIKKKFKISLPNSNKKKIIYESDDKATFIPNSRLQEMSIAEIGKEFQELIEEINKFRNTR
ncbi:MAG: hypothetical protein PVF58_19320 [Candidatus Methanofastidiosia archaeon]|jgi:hypothetical protein